METKLTLKLDGQIIELAKKYAAIRQSSLSRLIEDYFRHLISDQPIAQKYSPLVRELSGIITKPSNDYTAYLTRKYA